MSQSNHSPITAFIHGACNAKTNVGVWSVIIKDANKRLERAHRKTHTTHNEMTLEAAMIALRSLESHSGRPITKFSNSQYLIKGITEWIIGWEAKGWRNANKKPTPYKDKWKAIKELSDKLNVQWCKVSTGDTGETQERAMVITAKAYEAGKHCHIIDTTPTQCDARHNATPRTKTANRCSLSGQYYVSIHL